MTLRLRVNRQNHVNYLSFFEILDLNNVKKDAKIKSAL